MKLYQTALAVVWGRGPERKSLAEVINSASTLTLCPLSLLLQSSFVIKSTICPVQEINSVANRVVSHKGFDESLLIQCENGLVRHRGPLSCNRL